MFVNEHNPAFSNPLIHASSPYLRQHAKNPVFWYPWGEEALARAKAEDKPILLSIGYSTCYWCHVMEREVFENLSIASLMNRCFINIKIDREEHPQLDEIYMVARQLLTHEGGWPNNIFLTPGLKPFYAGGTYGAQDAYGKPGFPRLIEWLNATWTTQRDEVEKNANEIADLMRNFLVAKAENSATDFVPMIAAAHAALVKNHDITSGGFYKAPKFPHENYLQFLLAHYEATGEQNSLDIAAFSLGKMAAGGINDQVGCGFHRYAVDKDWLVPHFEKMLYTQALLARTYTDAARLTGNPYLADVAKSICDFVAGLFTDGSGAFYAALDAETDQCEGAYYAWKAADIEKLLSPEETQFFIRHFGLADIPNFPGHKHPDGEVIIARAPLYQMAIEEKIPYVEIAAMAGQALNKLLAARNLRVSPHLDNKIIVGWNGLMIGALAHAGATFGHADYIARAEKAADYLLQYGVDDEGRLVRCITNGKAQHAATLEDYSYFIAGLISLYKANKKTETLEAAKALLSAAEELFEDTNEGGFFTTRADDNALIRVKNGDDSTLPNANAVMAENYANLFLITGELHYEQKAKRLLQFFLGGDTKLWHEYTTMLKAAITLQNSNIMAAAPMHNVVTLDCDLSPGAEIATLTVKMTVAKNYTIAADTTRLFIQGEGVQVISCEFPEHEKYEGEVLVVAELGFARELGGRPEISIMATYHPCNDQSCFAEASTTVRI